MEEMRIHEHPIAQPHHAHKTMNLQIVMYGRSTQHSWHSILTQWSKTVVVLYLNPGSVFTSSLVGTFNGPCLPVSPVYIILVQCQSIWLW